MEVFSFILRVRRGLIDLWRPIKRRAYKRVSLFFFYVYVFDLCGKSHHSNLSFHHYRLGTGSSTIYDSMYVRVSVDYPSNRTSIRATQSRSKINDDNNTSHSPMRVKTGTLDVFNALIARADRQQRRPCEITNVLWSVI